MRTAPFSFPGFNPSPQLAALIAQYTGGQQPGQQNPSAQQPTPQQPLPQPGGGGFGMPSPQMGGGIGGLPQPGGGDFGVSPGSDPRGFGGGGPNLSGGGLPQPGGFGAGLNPMQRFAMMRSMTPQSANQSSPINGLTPLVQALMARYGNGAML